MAHMGLLCLNDKPVYGITIKSIQTSSGTGKQELGT